MHRTRFTVVLVLAFLSLGHASPHNGVSDAEDPLVEAVHSRHKRQIGGGSGNACLQIYSVPKQEVQCQPTTEVVDALASLEDSLKDQLGQIEGLGTRIDEIDPNKEKKLPEEVEQRLATIDDVEKTQISHTEILNKLDSDLGHLTTRMEAIETADRQEIANLIELQSRLIQTTLKQANVSLHGEYIEKLASSTTDLSSRLQTLELELTTSLHEKENALEVSVQQSSTEAREKAEELRKKLEEFVQELRDKLAEETASRQTYQEETTQTSTHVGELDTQLAAVQEHQAACSSTQATLKKTVETLTSQLAEEREAKTSLSHKADQLQAAVALLEAGWASMRAELAVCTNSSQRLTLEFNRLVEMVNRREHLLPRTLKINDCQEVLRFFYPASGVYVINPDATTRPFEVFCEMKGDSEGWTVIQRRQTGETEFFRAWREYKFGFGDATKEYWIGLNNLHQMTSRRKYKLRVDLEDWDGKWFYAEYGTFFVEDEQNFFKLHVDGYQGDAGDSLQYHNLMPFSTFDNNNDKISDAKTGSCTTLCHGGWWYKDCFESNLNGRYYNQGPYSSRTGWGDGMVWKHVKKTNYYSLKSSVMKITPVSPGE